MKKTLLVVLAVVALAVGASAQGGLVSGITLDNRQTYAKVMSGAQIQAYKCLTDPCPDTPGTLPAVQLFKNQALTTLVQHTTYVLSDNNGNYNFWLSPATYLVCMSGTSFALQCQPVLVGSGSAGGGAPYPPAGVPDSAGIGGPWLASFTPQGTDTFVMTSDGVGNTNDCPMYDANGGLTDSGAPCGGGGGGGAPGGANTSVQFNNSGVFGGFGTWDGSAFNIGTIGQAYTSRTAGLFYGEDDTFDSGAGSKTISMTPGVFTAQQGATNASITNPFDVLLHYTDSGSGDPNLDNAFVEIKIDKFGQINTSNSNSIYGGSTVSPNFGLISDNSGIIVGGNTYGLYMHTNNQGTPSQEFGSFTTVENSQVQSGTDPVLVGHRVNVTNSVVGSNANKYGMILDMSSAGSSGSSQVWGLQILGPSTQRAMELTGVLQIDSQFFSNIPACDGLHDGTLQPITDSPTAAGGATVTTGGGSVHAMLFCDGTNWRVGAASGSSTVTAGVSSINGVGGAFTFSGGGVSCLGTGCTFSGAGTPAYPQTVSGTVNSGGIPYGATTTQIQISPTLAQYGILVGGGAGQPPHALTVDHTTTHFLAMTAGDPTPRAIASGDIPILNQSTTGNAATATAAQSAPTLCPTGQAPRGVDTNFNASGCQTVGGGSSGVPSVNGITSAVTIAQGTNVTVSTVGSTVTISSTGGGGGGTVNSVTASAPLASSGGANPNITASVHGTDTSLQTSDGTGAAGNCPQYKAGGGLTDSGAPCNSINASHAMYNVGLYTMNTGSSVVCTGSGPYTCTITIPSSFGINSGSFCNANANDTTAAGYLTPSNLPITTPGSNSIVFGFTGALGGRVWFTCSAN